MAAEVQVIPGAAPFSFEGGERGCLLVHGFTGNPSSLKPMGEYLAGEGITVVGPRLKGHGTSVDDMAACISRDWLDSAEAGLKELSFRCKIVFVAGLSMGGTISLYLAHRFPELVSGVVPICAPVIFKDPKFALLPLLKRFIKTVPGVGSDIKDPAVKESSYDKVPVRAVPEMLAICKLAKEALPEIKQPALVFGAREDHVVPALNPSYIYEHLGSAQKELIWLENSYHVATLDYDKEIIFSRTAAFIKGA